MSISVPMRDSVSKGNTRWLPFSRQTPHDSVKATRDLRSSSHDILEKPISTLARHCTHRLSDIREASSSSKTATVRRQASGMIDGANELPSTPIAPRETASDTTLSEYATPGNIEGTHKSPQKGLHSRATSTMSLHKADVPKRRSSASIFAQSISGSHKGSLQDMTSWKLPSSSKSGPSVPRNRARADSPVRAAVGRAAQSSEALRPSPSRTFVRTTPPLEVLDNGTARHQRVEMSVRLPSPLFVGGGTIEGQISLEVDARTARKSKEKPIYISKLSVDVMGVEEISDGRRWVFLSLASELLDERHPPPPAMVVSQEPVSGSERCWELQPSQVVIPFCVNLPLNLGPPPYLSKHACIRYLLCPSVVIKVGEKRSVIRQTWNIQMLTVHDPEKALASLPSPLLATDSVVVAQDPEMQAVKLTAGLHRQIWVNGSMIFVDVHVGNGSAKSVKRIEVQLEKVSLWYSHAAAGTAEKSASFLRLPRRSDNEIVSTTVIKKSKEWSGLSSHSSEVRTCKLEAPRGHVSISTGRYFEVRYFVNVIVTAAMFKRVAVQLPITLIHINSLDILPNSLAQVAASIEAKRGSTVCTAERGQSRRQYQQGQAFSAPRRQSLDRARSVTADRDMDLLTKDLDDSPRRYRSGRCHEHAHNRNSNSATVVYSENTNPNRQSVSSSHHHPMRHPSCYHCHLAYMESGGRPSTAATQPGPKLPRLQVSTSGLGFSESEFEVPADSPPRKVMLSEQERKMINQDKELKLQRQWSQIDHQNSRLDNVNRDMQTKMRDDFWGWKNVAAAPGAGPKQPEHGNLSAGGIGRHASIRVQGTSKMNQHKRSGRTRSSTIPEKAIAGSSKRLQRPQSMDRSRRLSNMDGATNNSRPTRASRDRGLQGSVDRLF